jgi:hypothetical protein
LTRAPQNSSQQEEPDSQQEEWHASNKMNKKSPKPSSNLKMVSPKTTLNKKSPGALAMLVQTDRTRLDVNTEQSNKSHISPPLACNSIQYRWMGGICKLGAIHTDKLKFQYK